ncbi:epoxide hydrolase [Micromonospora polyrhachis]|uniref:Pimeloyl-ACP methyl ester carboxylesterase n=1 Tax=Micromonospora polyrhachis TaxID=1282883 RepID=A0A7W7SMP5_9ACTN|nr:epoxide hydrolase family protein [Micromonospora polyrhachis]MBB4957595.1 pimeloyl-ACP methyl ester carboxylesterase [Micromonospora polyrhachis]
MENTQPFRVEIAESDLDDLRDRLAKTRWPDELPGVGWSYGINKDYLVELVGYWRSGYDWRRHEARLNEFPQFTTTIDGQNIHFLHVRSPESDATPLIMTHGWPSTVYDFLDVIGPLTDPRAHGADPADAFHLVVPSVPGFAFSGPTRDTGWGSNRTARAWAELMRGLGYQRYGAQGGDFGSIVSPELGRVAPDEVIGVHVNALANASVPTDPSDLDKLSEAERKLAQEQEMWWYEHSGYATQMSTRPQTLAYALNDSPAGQLAWNLEWFVDWDPTTSERTPVDRDAILSNVSIFWLTGTAGSAARIYREAGAEGWGERPASSPVPTGVANFLGDRALRGLAELSNNVTHWSEFDRGGHFASLQAPGLLVTDIREFFRQVGSGG